MIHDDDFDAFLKESEDSDSSMSRYLTCMNAKEEKSDVKEYEEEKDEKYMTSAFDHVPVLRAPVPHFSYPKVQIPIPPPPIPTAPPVPHVPHEIEGIGADLHDR